MPQTEDLRLVYKGQRAKLASVSANVSCRSGSRPSQISSDRLKLTGPGPTLNWRNVPPLIGQRRAEADPVAGSRNRPVSLAALALVADIELLLDDCLRPNRAERRHLIVRWSSLPFGQLVLAGFGNALNAETICSRIQWCAGDPECRV